MDIIEIDVEPESSKATDGKAKRKRRTKEEIEQEKVRNIFLMSMEIYINNCFRWKRKSTEFDVK